MFIYFCIPTQLCHGRIKSVSSFIFQFQREKERKREHTRCADNELFNLYKTFWTNLFLMFDDWCTQVPVHMHTRAVLEVLPKLANATCQRTKQNNDDPCLETCMFYTLYFLLPVLQHHNGCFLCLHKSSLFTIICFPIPFPWWYKRFQFQFVTAGAVKTLMWQSSLVHFSTILLIAS